MAILNDIRKHGIFLIIIIALALFSFVLSGVIGNGNSTPKGESIVGTINGVDLPREQFMKKVETIQRNLGPNSPTNQAINIVWDREIRRVLLSEQYESLGLTAEKEQINNSLRTSLANNPTFQDEFGLFNELKLQEYLANVKNAADNGNSQAYNAWLDFEADTENSFQLFQNGLAEIVVRLVNCNHIEVKRQALRCLSSMCIVVNRVPRDFNVDFRLNHSFLTWFHNVWGVGKKRFPT